MSWIPAFELGIWNALIFMIWLIVVPVSSTFIIKEKKGCKRYHNKFYGDSEYCEKCQRKIMREK